VQSDETDNRDRARFLGAIRRELLDGLDIQALAKLLAAGRRVLLGELEYRAHRCPEE
jgi:hypothetical protein